MRTDAVDVSGLGDSDESGNGSEDEFEDAVEGGLEERFGMEKEEERISQSQAMGLRGGICVSGWSPQWDTVLRMDTVSGWCV